MKWRRKVPLILLFSLICAEWALGQSSVLGNRNAIVLDAKWIKDQELIVANLASEIQVWNYKDQQLINRLPASQILAIDYHDNRLAGVSKSGNITIWNIQSGKESLQKNISVSPLTSVAWIDSLFVVASNEQGDLLKINSISGEIISKISNPVPITAMMVDNNQTLITGDETGKICIYDARDLKLVSSNRGHSSWIRGIAIADSNQSFVTVSDDGRLKKWNSSKQVVSTYTERSIGNWFLCADFFYSKQFYLITSGKRNGQIKIKTSLGEYSMDLNSIINSICILESELPNIVIVVATHGKGIHVIRGSSMKLKS